jgi:hypothetical protein
METNTMTAFDKLQDDYQRYIENVEAQAKAQKEKIRLDLEALKIKATQITSTA